MTHLVSVGLLIAALVQPVGGPTPAAFAAQPLAVPRALLRALGPALGAETSLPRRIIRVRAGGNLQAAINAARPGDFIELAAGATFVGNFVLPHKDEPRWIVIYSSAVWRLPPPGTRISPDHAPFMPKIVSPNASPAIAAAEAAHHYAFVGIEFTTTSAALDDLLYLDFRGQNRLEQVPTDIVLFQCYIHGTPTGEIRRGVALNGARLAVIGSYLSDFHHTLEDSHAIQGWNGPGPYTIIGNYLEAAGENVMFGGDDPLIDNLVPSDIVIRGNYFTKSLTWRQGNIDPPYAGIPWVVKNLFELKNARRVLVEGNIFEHSWPMTQFGSAILLTPRNQDGGAPWSVVEDVTFVNNVVRHSTGGISFLGWDNLCVPVPGASACSGQLKRMLIRNNLFVDVGAYADLTTLPEEGTLFLIADGPADLVVDHNTFVQTGSPIKVNDNGTGRWPAPGFVFTNNIVLNNDGVGNNQGIGGGPLGTLDTYFRSATFGYVFARNVLVGGNALDYPSDNFFPPSLLDVGFEDLAGGDYALAPTSPFSHLATDGTNIGADIEALQDALLRWW